MQYLGEIISLGVACSWTVTALVSEIGTRRIGVLNFNVWRLGTALLFTAVMVYALTGKVGPAYAGWETWMWMGLSGFVGFFLGDYCLFKSYIYISSRYSQLFMTLAPAAAAIAAWVTLGETMTWKNILAMTITLSGIGIAVGQTPSNSPQGGERLIPSDGNKGASLKGYLNLPSLGGEGGGLVGVLYALGAAIGQGFGLVLSKIGMEHYEADIPAAMASEMESVIPFSANMIRCVAGFLCFLLVVLLGKGGKVLAGNVKDKKAMKMMLTAVMFGPFLGVGFSLMAVQYTNVGIAQTLMALTPILIILPSYWIFKQPVTLKGVIGACVSVVGAALFF